ncbi:hypothetical protein, partial [Ideonella sp.]|uniref:hypothetical protein n=1 Tax=Ideonella sp. TaxID=1929293 RepID=UPI003BB79F33
MALTLQTLLLRVQQSCAKHGAELPPTVQEWAQLPQPTAGELANRLRLQWLRGGSAPLDWQWQVLLWVIDQDWAELALRQRLSSDLLAPWLRGHAALGRRVRLAEFQAAAGPVLAEPALLPQAMLVLRALRTVGAVQATRRLVEQLLGSVEPEAACLPELARSVAMVSRQAEGLPALQWAGACLARWLPLVSGPAFPPRHWPPGDAQGFLVALGVIANRTVDCDALRLLGAHLCTLDRSPELEAVLGGMLSTLASFDAGEGSFELLELAGRRLPDSAVVQLERARAALARGASLATLGAMLMPLDAAAPGFRSAMSWLANHLFHSDLIPQAVQVLERLEQAQLLNEADRLRLQHLRARGLADLASGAAGGEPLDRLRLAERAFEGLPSSFAPLTSLIALAPVHDAQDTLSQWALRCESVAQAFATELSQARARGEGTALHVSVAAARQLMQIGEELYSTHTVALDLVPFPLTVAYGRIDPLRCRCVFATLNRALSSLFEELLDQARPFASVSGESGLKDWLTLMRMACEAWLQLDQPERSLALLESARQKLGPGLGRSHVQLLMERVRLAQGDMLGAAKE